MTAGNPVKPNKLHLSKWITVPPVAKQKHFLVSRVIKPELHDAPIEFVELEAASSRATQFLSWRELQNAKVWRQGWV
ncbi:TIGR02450 family Trp-rich protein [Hydrogenophaga sp.]|uniref:TIGR02450 family Trp-rich protein n=1 Tax=Hydrogenophaga sp. TaxID=1904254 RepID=UPI003F6CE0D0